MKNKSLVNKVLSTPKPKRGKIITELRIWMLQNNINQKDLAKSSGLSANAVNRLINEGYASKSVVKLVSFELGITLKQLKDLLKEVQPLNSKTIND